MPRPQYARHRVDATQASITAALEKAGWKVYRDLPCDIIAFKAGRWKALECKVPTAKGKPKLDKRQVDQAQFCAETGTPYVTTAEQALRAVGEIE